MCETIRVLVVDDEKPMRQSLRQGFGASRNFKYDVVCVERPEDCVDMEESHESSFDVCIIDLGFSSADTELVGYKMLLGLACVRSQGIALVYSGHPAISNVVRAMQLGATDFVSKTDCPPHRLVEHVEAIIAQRSKQEEEWGIINAFLQEQNEELGRQYPGRVLAIIVEDQQAVVMANGKSRLDTLLKYSELRGDANGSKWPVDPHLHIVPHLAETKGKGR